MALAIFALRQSAQPPRLEMPTPQCSDRFSLMHPEPSHPASSPITSGQDKIAPPQLTTSRARNGRLRNFRPDQGIPRWPPFHCDVNRLSEHSRTMNRVPEKMSFTHAELESIAGSTSHEVSTPIRSPAVN